MRPSARKPDEMREVQFTRHYIKHPEGSILVAFGDTKVLCNASVVPGVPKFLKGSGQGWITAEYAMLPRATAERTMREAIQGRPASRTQEIQRLIGRSLRPSVDLSALGEYTITLDCDVLQADGGTRTASITGSCLALAQALQWMRKRRLIKTYPLKYLTASVSVGLVEGEARLDLDYLEDKQAETDMNVVMNEQQDFIEIQGTAEKRAFRHSECLQMLALAQKGIQDLIHKQKRILDFILA